MADSGKDRRLPRELLADDVLRIQQRIDRAQQRARQYVKPGVSLVDELIAERSTEAEREEEIP
jgi:hypothetical protein